jgi:hypothetical protein
LIQSPAVLALPSVGPGLAQINFANLLLIVLNFYAMANAIRAVFDQDYRMTNATAGTMFATQLLTGITFAFLNIMAIVRH